MYRIHTTPFNPKSDPLATTVTVDAAIVEAKKQAWTLGRDTCVFGDSRIRVLVTITPTGACAVWAVPCKPCKGTGTGATVATGYGGYAGNCERCSGSGVIGDNPCQ
jgi:hypothetical protein